MKKMRESDVRAAVSFIAFFALIIIAAKNGVVLRDYEYIQLLTIMLAGFMAGGGR